VASIDHLEEDFGHDRLLPLDGVYVYADRGVAGRGGANGWRTRAGVRERARVRAGRGDELVKACKDADEDGGGRGGGKALGRLR